MNATDIKHIKTDIFVILGVIHVGHNKVVCNEGVAILALAWRCLYAELVKSRIDDKNPNLETALKRTVAMLIADWQSHRLRRKMEIMVSQTAAHNHVQESADETQGFQTRHGGRERRI